MTETLTSQKAQAFVIRADRGSESRWLNAAGVFAIDRRDAHTSSEAAANFAAADIQANYNRHEGEGEVTVTVEKVNLCSTAFVVGVVYGWGSDADRRIELGETSDTVLADIAPNAMIVDRYGKTGDFIHAIDGNGNDVMVAPYNPNNPADVRLAARSLLAI